MVCFSSCETSLFETLGSSFELYASLNASSSNELAHVSNRLESRDDKQTQRLLLNIQPMGWTKFYRYSDIPGHFLTNHECIFCATTFLHQSIFIIFTFFNWFLWSFSKHARNFTSFVWKQFLTIKNVQSVCFKNILHNV